MKPISAWLGAALLLAGTVSLFWAPPALLVFVVWAAFLAAPQSRLGLLLFVTITVVLDSILLAWSEPGTGALWSLGPLTFGAEGARRGAIGGLRLSAIVLVNLAFFGRVGIGAWLDGLRLPRRATMFLGALLLACQDVAVDARRLYEARSMSNTWPTKRWGRIVATAGLVAPLMVAGVDRARRRKDALLLAGVRPGRVFIPVIAVTAIALAGRMALIAVPNISLTYVVVFAGGIAFGPLVGVLAGLTSMGLSNIMLSGFAPGAYANVPAMAVVGLFGGVLARFDMTQPGSRWVLASWGVLATFGFSILADVSEWFLIPEFRNSATFLQARIIGGLAFNVVPAATNAVLFAAVVPAVQRAFRRPGQSEHRP